MPKVQGQGRADDIAVKITVGRTSSIDNVETAQKALHEDIEIKYFYEGTATLLVGTKTITVKAGDIVVINPYEFHATIDCGEEKGKYHLFMVPLDFFSQTDVSDLDLRSFIFARKKSFKTLHSGDKEMARILSLAGKEYDEKKLAYPAAIRGLMMEFFVQLLRQGVQEEGSYVLQSDALHSYRLIEPALRHIRDNYSESFAVEKLAELCKVSKFYFCRIFKKVTGKTAMEYLRDYRIQVSDVMLRNTDKNISQIAEICGFESANYYCRCYKNLYGFSPSKRR